MEPTFGARLTSWLKFRKMSAAALARGFGDDTTRRAVHSWLHDYASPAANRIVPICQILGVTVAEFFARMPSEEAPEQSPEDDECSPHPLTGDITREFAPGEIEAQLNRNACESCKGTGFKPGEAA
jgi:transcriptional regulator with XRE-family HTH domain